jgi:hypothetical protein
MPRVSCRLPLQSFWQFAGWDNLDFPLFGNAAVFLFFGIVHSFDIRFFLVERKLAPHLPSKTLFRSLFQGSFWPFWIFIPGFPKPAKEHIWLAVSAYVYMIARRQQINCRSE